MVSGEAPLPSAGGIETLGVGTAANLMYWGTAKVWWGRYFCNHATVVWQPRVKELSRGLQGGPQSEA